MKEIYDACKKKSERCTESNMDSKRSIVPILMRKAKAIRKDVREFITVRITNDDESFGIIRR